MTDQVAVWWTSHKQHVLGNEPLWDTYAEFQAALFRDFRNPNEQAEAKTELALQIMRNNESITDFISRIRILQGKAKVQLDRLWEILLVALTPEIRHVLQKEDADIFPKSQAHAFQLVNEAGAKYERKRQKEILYKENKKTLELIKAGGKGKGGSGSGSLAKETKTADPPKQNTSSNRVTKRAQRKPKNAKGKTAAPSETNTNTTNHKPKNDLEGIPQAVIDKRKADNRCFRCGATGHTLRECTGQKRKQDYVPKGKGKAAEADKKVAMVEVEDESIHYGRWNFDQEVEQDAKMST